MKGRKKKIQEAHLQYGQCDEEESLASLGLEGQISLFKTHDFVELFRKSIFRMQHIIMQR